MYSTAVTSLVCAIRPCSSQTHIKSSLHDDETTAGNVSFGTEELMTVFT